MLAAAPRWNPAAAAEESVTAPREKAHRETTMGSVSRTTTNPVRYANEDHHGKAAEHLAAMLFVHRAQAEVGRDSGMLKDMTPDGEIMVYHPKSETRMIVRQHDERTKLKPGEGVYETTEGKMVVRPHDGSPWPPPHASPVVNKNPFADETPAKADEGESTDD